MTIRLYNTLHHQLEEFVPEVEGEVRMYNCGPTVYSDPHIGNMRSFLMADLLRRVFDQRGYKTTQVMNITDVGHLTVDDVADAEGEDKLEKMARAQGVDPFQIARRYEEIFFENLDTLGARRAHHYPRATEHVPEMIAMIERLIASEHAYVVEGVGVYFRVHTFSEYGQLSGNTLEELDAGSRIEVDDRKESPHDFALWKIDDKHLMQWESPFGRGFPGWHIECSAMSEKYLGVTFDVHTGGEDNIFPHHECERAQSLCSTDGEFARTWVHARHLLVDGAKMSKSKGSFFTINDLITKGYEGFEIRYTLISPHYRQPTNFRLDGLEGDRKAISRLRGLAGRLAADAAGLAGGDLEDLGASPEWVERLTAAQSQFDACLDDDLNVSGGLGVVHDTAKLLARADLPAEDAAAGLAFLKHVDEILCVIFAEASAQTDALSAEEQELLDARSAARTSKDWARSDELRDALLAHGVVIKDSPLGVTWERKR